MSISPICAAALAYASERNWTSFPVPPGKKKSHLKAKHSNGVRWGATKLAAIIANGLMPTSEFRPDPRTEFSWSRPTRRKATTLTASLR
jgi:hypothetical protein